MTNVTYILDLFLMMAQDDINLNLKVIIWSCYDNNNMKIKKQKTDWEHAVHMLCLRGSREFSLWMELMLDWLHKTTVQTALVCRLTFDCIVVFPLNVLVFHLRSHYGRLKRTKIAFEIMFPGWKIGNRSLLNTTIGFQWESYEPDASFWVV